MPSLNGYVDLYSSDLDDAPVFQEIFNSNKTANPINTYYVVPKSVTLVSTPTKVLKKRCNIGSMKNLGTIKRSQSDTTDSARFLSTALHSVSQAIIHAHTYKIALYNKSDIYCCADSGESKEMFPD